MNPHSNGKYFVAVCSKYFNLSPEVGIPESDGSILTAGENVLGGTLGISSNIDRTFVAIEGDMNRAW